MKRYSNIHVLKEHTLRVVSGNFCEVLTGKFETADVLVHFFENGDRNVKSKYYT